MKYSKIFRRMVGTLISFGVVWIGNYLFSDGLYKLYSLPRDKNIHSCWPSKSSFAIFAGSIQNRMAANILSGGLSRSSQIHCWSLQNVRFTNFFIYLTQFPLWNLFFRERNSIRNFVFVFNEAKFDSVDDFLAVIYSWDICLHPVAFLTFYWHFYVSKSEKL